MAVEGVDYSYDHPTVAQLKAAGKQFACRYLTGTTDPATPTTSKNLTPAEAKALRAGGIDIVSNVETSAGFLLDGYSATAKVAERCWRQHKWCGGPDNRPLYFSLDIDATLDQYKVALQGLKGAGSAIGWGNVGLYGGLFPIEWAHGDGVKWLWQSLGWAYGGGTSKHALIRQYDNGVTLGSGTVDLDRAFVADFGQWSKEADMPLTDADIPVIRKALGLPAGEDVASEKSIRLLLRGDATHVDSLKSIHDDTKAILEAVKAAADPAAVAKLVAGELEITGISTDTGGVVTVTFGPKAPA